MADVQISLFTHPFLTNFLLPFLLVFVVIFAILEKSNVLGEGKKYANLIVAIVIGLLFIGMQSVVGFTIKLLPLVAVLVVVLLGYYIIFGFIGIHEKTGLKITLGIVFGLALIISILWATGVLEKIGGSFSPETVGTIIFLAILGGAIALVLTTKVKEKGE
ncbi:MAG: hypothetical protein QXK80_03225 [Candidatus Pacearchaeota archaeon]